MTIQDHANWNVRKACVDDVDALSLIGSATFLETFSGILSGEAVIAHCRKSHSASAYQSYLEAGAHVWIAELDPGAAPIGFAVVGTPDLAAAQAGDVELKRIYVLSRFHGAGIGPRLMSQVINEVSDFERILLGVYAGNERAQAFYRKNGFEKIADRKFDVGGTLYDDIVFARTID